MKRPPESAIKDKILCSIFDTYTPAYLGIYIRVDDKHKLTANVRRITGRTIHAEGRLDNGMPVAAERLPDAVRLDIEEKDEGVFLYRYDILGQMVSDTWHETIAEAMDQALFEYEVVESDWRPVIE
jgi:hypothetical protein